MPVMSAPALPVTQTQRAQLQKMAASTTSPHRKVVQAKALLWAAQGLANQEIARRCEVDSDTVRRWRARFADKGADGVGVIAKGRGRKPALPEGTVAEIVRVTCHETPDDTSTHWTTRSLAKRFGIGKDAIARVWADHNLKPWRVDNFKLSSDPHFEEKLVDVVGLYMNPPARAAVFSFDEKTQCQAMDLATGQVLTHCHKGHTAKDVLAFFKQIDASVPKGLAVHVVLDNLLAHKAPEITKWLSHRDRGRWHLHFTPTSSSWVNLIERWFKELTDKRLRRGVFTNVPELIEAITTWGSHWNHDPKPFIWHTSADEIIEKVQRGRAALNRQINSTTEH